jgi:hypothetical protein
MSEIEITEPLTSETWRKHCDAWSAVEKTGISKVDFCRTRGLSEKRFYYWNARFNKQPHDAGLNNFSRVVVKEDRTSFYQECYIILELLLPNQSLLKFKLKEERALSFVKELSDASAIIR